MVNEFESVIGLEVHAQLSTKSKIFCGCSTKFGEEPNTQACPVCLGLPGSLPVLNQKVVEYTITAALSTGCIMPAKSIFARKNYFYPDLPKGYQISQYEKPLAENGFVFINNGDEKEKKIRIRRIHMEEDAGKLLHDRDPFGSLFDVNRCGTPLIEIVTEPDLSTPAEAFLYLTELKQILEYLGICDCNMEEGSLRCDANISIRPKGTTGLGTKTELKNMNSFHGVQKALEYEIARQIDAVSHNEKIIQQTLLWDAKKNVALPMRSKEDAHDYRYFPEPDLIPLTLEEKWIKEIEKNLPELPAQKRKRFQKQYSLRAYDCEVLCGSRFLADFFEDTVKIFSDSKMVSNWIQTEILRIAKEKKCEPNQLKSTPKKLASLLQLVKDQTVNQSAAKEILDEVEATDQDPLQIIQRKGLAQISDEKTIEQQIESILAKNPQEVAAYKAGKEKLWGFFVGQVMKETKGKANPAVINKILKEKIGHKTA